jgi:hypothetical protein
MAPYNIAPNKRKIRDYNSCNIIGRRRHPALAIIDAANAKAIFGADR